jgi:hypothetical protein
VEPIGALTDPGVSQKIRSTLAPTGSKVTLADNTELCELWLRNAVSSAPQREVPGAVFPQLPDSSLLGVLAVKKGFTDYRGQAPQPGFYTLRYALLPNDGNHMGVAPSRDFVLLIPVADDQDPDAVFKPLQLIQLSRKASRTNHPAPLSLVQPESAAAPQLTTDFEGHIILTLNVNVGGTQLPVGFVVKGRGQ